MVKAGIAAEHIWAPVHALNAPVLIQRPSNTLNEITEDGQNASAPATHEEDVDETPGSWLPPGPALAMEAICE